MRSQTKQSQILTLPDILDAERRNDQEQLRRIRDAVRGYPYNPPLGQHSQPANPYSSQYSAHTSPTSASPGYYNNSHNQRLPPVTSITNNMPPGSNYTARMFGRHSVKDGHLLTITTARVTFKDSPFYTVQKQISTLYELKAREQTRDTARLTISLDEDTASRMCKDQTLRAFVFCATDSYEAAYKPSDIAFPTHAELKVNQEDVKVNLKGLKGKPGSTRPVDITSFIRKRPGYPNVVELVYALTTKVRLLPSIPRSSLRTSQISRNLLCAYRVRLHRSTSFSSTSSKSDR